MGKTHVHIHPDFASYAEFIHAVPAHEYPVDLVFCNQRNVVELTHIGNTQLVVKKYRTPIWVNRVAYTFFRKSKAQRAYENAQLLSDLDIRTAAPVAYIIQESGGLIRETWFISLYIPHVPLINFCQDPENRDQLDALWKELGQFMLHAHLNGIFFPDNNGGNILVSQTPLGLQLSVVDINRLRRGKVPSLEEAMQSFEQLGLDEYTLLSPLSYYAQARQFDWERCIQQLARHRKSHNRQLTLKRLLHS